MSYTGDSPMNQTVVQLQQCRKNLQLSVSEAKNSIQSNVSRILEMARSREVFLMNQLDVIQRLSDDIIRTHEMAVYRALNAAEDQLMTSMTSLNFAATAYTEPDTVDHLMSLPASVSAIRFEADLSAMLQAVCQFGKVIATEPAAAATLPRTDHATERQMSSSLNVSSTFFNSRLAGSSSSSIIQYPEPEAHVTSPMTDQHETDHDDFVVIAEDDDVSSVAEQVENFGNTGCSIITNLTIVDEPNKSELNITHDGALLSSELVTTEDDDNHGSDESNNLICFSASRNVGDEGLDHGTTAEHKEATEHGSVMSDYLARISSLPIDHWLIR